MAFNFYKVHSSLQQKSSGYSLVKLLLSKSNILKSQPLKFGDLEQPGPVSVLETSSEDETYSSSCFERLSAELKGKPTKLSQMLASPYVSRFSYFAYLVWQNCRTYNGINRDICRGKWGFSCRDNEDCAGSDSIRDFTNLIAILVESDIQCINVNKLLNACCLLNCSLNQSVEKKHDGVAADYSAARKRDPWAQRGERKDAPTTGTSSTRCTCNWSTCSVAKWLNKLDEDWPKTG